MYVDALDRSPAAPVPESRGAARPRRAALWRVCRWLTYAGGLAAVAWAAYLEMRTSTLQAVVATALAGDMSFQAAPGASDSIRFPSYGPYDERLGYVELPSMIARLGRLDFRIEQQARVSPVLAAFMDHGGFAPFAEKTQAGLTLLDRNGAVYFASRQPRQIYPDFDDIPPRVVETLLFIENRELLDPVTSWANPAIEWDRFAIAAVDLLTRKAFAQGRSAGGSTLATQMEKFRHSPGGRTVDAVEKLRQMGSATLRAYALGPDTSGIRRRIVLDYLNATPLAGRAGYGEVVGLRDGLRVWYGAEPEAVDAALREPVGDGESLRRQAGAYRQVLSLLLAQRQPSGLLAGKREALEALTDRYLGLLEGAGVIPSRLARAALQIRTPADEGAAIGYAVEFEAAVKAATRLRIELLGSLGVDRLYDLDRLDLSVETTVDSRSETQAADLLRSLASPAEVAARGLDGAYLLQRGDPAAVVYSFALYERGGDADYLRIQTDSEDRPFDVNEGAKLDLGSTAKLRTLVSYLEVVAGAWARHQGPAGAAAAVPQGKVSDPLGQWVAEHLARTKDPSLPAVLAAALERRYSASPYERFFTAGGSHTFANFDRDDNGRTMTVAEAFRRSVNLVFIRMMRDIENHHIARILADGANPYDHASPARQAYLARFADQEGTEFLRGFYRIYAGLEPDAIVATIGGRTRPIATRLAVVFRSLRPDADMASMAAFIRSHAPKLSLAEKELQRLYEKYAKDNYSLNDRAYIAQIHPLELWLAARRLEAPEEAFQDIAAAGVDVRQEVYRWLFKPGRTAAQDKRIRMLLEQDAFRRIHASWQRLGYPFATLVPSYATSIGASGDRPSALAALMGIIVNDGVRMPLVRIERLRFAAGTPYETVMALDPPPGERVLSREVAQAVRGMLVQTVELGTGKRASGRFVGPDGKPLTIGGKTGTGDHRYERFAGGGRLIASEARGRTATFVFFIGERFYGVITAHVAGSEAANYRFTSALPTQLLVELAPVIQPMIAPAGAPKPVAETTAALASGLQTVSGN